MENNQLIIKSKNGKKSIYDVIIIVSGKDYEYIIYTDNKKNKNGELNVYFAKYKEDLSKIKDVTLKEEKELINILNKFNEDERGAQSE